VQKWARFFVQEEKVLFFQSSAVFIPPFRLSAIGGFNRVPFSEPCFRKNFVAFIHHSGGTSSRHRANYSCLLFVTYCTSAPS